MPVNVVVMCSVCLYQTYSLTLERILGNNIIRISFRIPRVVVLFVWGGVIIKGKKGRRFRNARLTS
jgi:hypothetical protein